MEPRLALLFAFPTQGLRADSPASALSCIRDNTQPCVRLSREAGGEMHSGHREEFVLSIAFESCRSGTSLKNWAPGEKGRRNGVKGDSELGRRKGGGRGPTEG